MASQLVWKVYSGRELRASTTYAEDAAMVVGNITDGTVKVDGRIVWREGREAHSACESFDGAAETMTNRRRTNSLERYARIMGDIKVGE